LLHDDDDDLVDSILDWFSKEGVIEEVDSQRNICESLGSSETTIVWKKHKFEQNL